MKGRDNEVMALAWKEKMEKTVVGGERGKQERKLE